MFSIRSLVPRTLLARFMLIIILPTIIGQLLLIFLFYDRHWSSVSYRTSTIITNEILLLLDSDYKKNNIATDYLNLSYIFLKGKKLEEKQPYLQEELMIFKSVLDAKVHIPSVVKINEDRKVEALFQVEEGVVKAVFSAKLLVNATSYIFVLWMVCLTVLLLLVSLLFCRKQIKSILELAAAADSFGRNKKLDSQYYPSGAREIRRAGIAFLKMKERIERQVMKRTQMLAMISHDLRTPLTRMKLQLELMEDSADKTELAHDIETMRQMIDSYLAFARGEGGEEFKAVNLVSWFENYLGTKWNNHDIEFAPKQKAITGMIKVQSFERAISNLVGNAIKYAKQVRVSLFKKDSYITIIIEDNGKGIKDEEKALVFRPFYRSDKSRAIETGGSVGLGLAIAKEIIIAHNGTIELENSRELGGLLVKITLPV